MKKVSIISVNYNGLSYTCQMIDSLRKYETHPYEIIIVDNGSTKNEAEALRLRYSDIIIVRSEKNLGFAGGNNLGIRQATSNLLLFLNNDTEIRAPFLSSLVESLESDATIGCVSPKIKFEYIPNTIQFAGYTPLSKFTLRNHLIGFMEEDQGQYNTPHFTPYAHGAAMMVKKEVIEKAGEMPELFFLYYEELDWCQRITEAGYQIQYEPNSTVFHKESATTGEFSALKTYYMTRNRLLFAKRNRHGVTKIIACTYQCIIVFPKNLLNCLYKKRPDLAMATCKGLWNGIKHETWK